MRYADDGAATGFDFSIYAGGFVVLAILALVAVRVLLEK